MREAGSTKVSNRAASARVGGLHGSALCSHLHGNTRTNTGFLSFFNNLTFHCVTLFSPVFCCVGSSSGVKEMPTMTTYFSQQEFDAIRAELTGLAALRWLALAGKPLTAAEAAPLDEILADFFRATRHRAF